MSQILDVNKKLRQKGIVINYYPFGMVTPGRSFAAGSGYRFGFNGKESDAETYGSGNIYDYGFRIYNPRLGKFLSVDPLSLKLSANTPYSIAFNSPIFFIDVNGLFPYSIHVRSFAPFESFGGGFSGDGNNRKFSTSPTVTSRVQQTFTVDPTAGSITEPVTWSDPSHHPLLGSRTEVPEGELSNIEKDNDGYGNSTLKFNSSMAGANPLVPLSPDIDVSTAFTITENTNTGNLDVIAYQYGDKFPSAETFITDAEGTSLFIGVSQYEGDPYTSLPGDNCREMMSSSFTIWIDQKGMFMGVEQDDVVYSISDWNKKFENQATKVEEPTGFKGGDSGGGGAGSGWIP